MRSQTAIVLIAVLAGAGAFFAVRASGLEVTWPQWLTPLAIALVVFGGMTAARKRKQQ